MTKKLIAAVAFSLALGGAAIAQEAAGTQGRNATSPGAANEMGMPSGWEGPLADTFFSDSEAGTMRSQDEIQTNWGNLSAEQQAQVRADCEQVNLAGQQKTHPGDADDEMTTSSTTADGASYSASMQEVCNWVDSM